MKNYLSGLNINTVNYDFKVLTGLGVEILGQTDVNVNNNHNNRIVTSPIVILISKHKFTPLLGRNWVDDSNPNWRQIVCQGPSQNVGFMSRNISQSMSGNQNF